MAEQFLGGHQSLSWSPARWLVAVPERNGYALELPDNLDPADYGTITGLGPPPPENAAITREMAAALSLTPLFKASIEHDAETPWVYYTSALGFMYLYPPSPKSDFFYSAEIRDLDFIKGAHPEVNPKREAFWTPAYLDAAGKGWMVTVSTPVYEGDIFRGAISIDVSVGKLDLLLKQIAVPNSTVRLTLGDGRSLTRAEAVPLPYRPNALDPDEPAWIDDKIVSAVPLQFRDWFLVVETDKLATLIEVARNSLAFGFVALFLVGLVVLAFLLARALRKVEELSIVDALTGLYNRRMFDVSAEEEFGRGRRMRTGFALLLFDVDFFKRYNDTFGHQAGDGALRMIADAVRNALRRSTDKVFRIGGEEFAVLLSGADFGEAVHAAERVVEAVRALDAPHPGNPGGRLTVSVGGIAITGEPWLTPDQGYLLADAALYRAKAEGRDCCRIVDNTEPSRDAGAPPEANAG